MPKKKGAALDRLPDRHVRVASADPERLRGGGRSGRSRADCTPHREARAPADPATVPAKWLREWTAYGYRHASGRCRRRSYQDTSRRPSVDRAAGRHPPPDALADGAGGRRGDLPRARPRAAGGAGRRGGARPPPRRDARRGGLVAVYMFEGDGRLSYLLPARRAPARRQLGGEHRAQLPGRRRGRARRQRAAAGRPPATMSCALLLPLVERGEVEAVVMLVRRRLGEVYRAGVGRARAHARRPGRHGAGARARARRGRHRRRSPAA